MISGLRVGIAAVGLILIYVGAFLRESEEGELQNKLEDIWVRIDDAARAAIARHTAFFREIANAMLRPVERLFGPKIATWQAFGVSAMLSLSSLFFLASVVRPSMWWMFEFPFGRTYDEWLFIGVDFRGMVILSGLDQIPLILWAAVFAGIAIVPAY